MERTRRVREDLYQAGYKQTRIETAKQIFKELESLFWRDHNEGYYIKKLFSKGHFLNKDYKKIKAKFLQEEAK